jgi:plastocyanin
VARSRYLQFLLTVEFLGVMLFVLATGFPPFDDVSEVDLTAHMVQHVLIILAGVLIAYPHIGRMLLGKKRSPWLPRLALLDSIAIIVFWHLPGPWDSAVLNPAVHLLEHVSFLGVGLLAGSWLLLLSDSGKIGALTAAFFGHMGYAVALISPWGFQVYALYSLSDQAVLGWALLLTGPTLLIGVAYVLARNPDWLGGASGQKPGAVERRKTFLNEVKIPRWVAPTLSFIFVAILVVYFAATVYAIGTVPSTSSGAVVYISETPVTWNYTPQTIRVILGVNATVTWVSHSISFDTVTGRGGTFGSGTISPGGTYTFTFTAPGTYNYYCQFHPWMTGTVVVLRSAP